MSELWQCRICRSVVPRDQINGRCKTCGKNTCNHCKRVCDRCHEIVCMFHIESKVVMRQQQPYVHELCAVCREVW